MLCFDEKTRSKPSGDLLENKLSEEEQKPDAKKSIEPSSTAPLTTLTRDKVPGRRAPTRTTHTWLPSHAYIPRKDLSDQQEDEASQRSEQSTIEDTVIINAVSMSENQDSNSVGL